MSDVRALIQDLRAEAHRVPADVAELMRRAAIELADRTSAADLADASPEPAPIPPPEHDHAES